MWLVGVSSSLKIIVCFWICIKGGFTFGIADKENITLLGISAKYIDALRKFVPKLDYKYKLKKLRTICSTGSPLSNDSFNYIYKKLKIFI